jgi:GNAT superfamily N-acetyltransferase
VRIRDARPDDGERLREIAVAAKAHWGYELARVVSWAAQGDFSAAGLRAKHAFVAEEDGRVVGWAGVIPRGEAAWLDDLWIEPAAMRRGIGTALFEHAAAFARARGAARLEWEAEPNAVGFYERLGARHLRDSEPSEWGRILSVMGIDLRRP